MTYNGWTNWETWNVNLWIDNEEPLYREKQRFLKGMSHINEPVRGDQIRAFVVDHMGGTTPDFDSTDDMAKVNWEEIAEHWEAKRQEMNDA